MQLVGVAVALSGPAAVPQADGDAQRRGGAELVGRHEVAVRGARELGGALFLRSGQEAGAGQRADGVDAWAM